MRAGEVEKLDIRNEAGRWRRNRRGSEKKDECKR